MATADINQIKIKYIEAYEQFSNMNTAANEMLDETNRVREVTYNLVGSGWIGKDAQAYSSTVERYTTKLNQQAEQMLGLVETLIRQAKDSEQKELQDAQNAYNNL
jgi:hypothetical protein